jgi:magnesium-transporting ATPase (P-type)
MIPADCRILSAKDLFVSQAAMTGESMPVEKYALQHSMDVNSPLELDNLVFMGTNVVSGTAKAVVLIQVFKLILVHWHIGYCNRSQRDFISARCE